MEGFNNKIKILKRNVYGFRIYYHFINIILLISRLYVRKKRKGDQTIISCLVSLNCHQPYSAQSLKNLTLES
ncbi:transposase [Facklamia sp. P12934]|uniref:transposase n=1 Tax=unclassified Facklamia TaxID=2622293 RepID=UPI003D1679DD